MHPPEVLPWGVRPKPPAVAGVRLDSMRTGLLLCAKDAQQLRVFLLLGLTYSTYSTSCLVQVSPIVRAKITPAMPQTTKVRNAMW